MPTFYVMRIITSTGFTSIEADSQQEAQQIADSLDTDEFSNPDIEITNIVSDPI